MTVTTQQEEAVPMHPLVGAILDTAKMQKDKFVIPANDLATFDKQIRTQHMEDLQLATHLVVAASRVKKKGLTHLAEQLVLLGKLGLEHRVQEKAQAQGEARAREAKKTLETPKSQQATGLKGASTGGVGLRGKRKS